MINEFDQQFHPPLCGIDEVGRGPLCGPVVAACAMIKPEFTNLEQWIAITDSKKLSAKKRDALFAFITEHCFYGIGHASIKEIDQLNIHHATLLAMKRAYEAMTEDNNAPTPQIALIDGKFAPDVKCNTQTVIKGDATSTTIGAASIIAKVTRDREMAALSQEYPQYGWERNVGYGTQEHLAALEEHGLTPHHRLSFAPCKKLVGARLANKVS